MEEEETIDIDTNYVKHFKSHVAGVSTHLNGTDHQHGPSRPSYLLSYFPPCGFWSPADKDRFFHALAVHSRLRPDLIAAEIPGKTVVDVCVYLDLLASASANQPKRWGRSALPPAIEVSNRWVEFEEEKAGAMAAMEATWEAEHREDRRAAALHAERCALRKQRGERPGGVRDREDEKRRKAVLKEFQEKQEAGWEKDDYMGELDAEHLRVIDSILREAEESSMASIPAKGSHSPTVGPVDMENVVSDSMIDPILLSVPGPSSVQPARSGHAPQEAAQDDYSSHVHDVQHDLEPQQFTALPVSSCLVNGTDINSPGPQTNYVDNPADAIVDLANLSPISRRRHQKRLYMRRKRAEQTGRVASATATRLKPGRKTNKKLQFMLARRKALEEEAEENMDVDEEAKLGAAMLTIANREEDEKEEYIDVHGGKEEVEISLRGDQDDNFRRASSPAEGRQEGEAATFHPHVGGVTPPYKIRKKLSDMGYDAATLESDGLGLFHLSRLADLMSLHASLGETESDAGTRISAPLIRLLHAEVVCFLTDVMHRAITVHEQERLSKEHTKVWRLREEQVKVGTIHQALGMLGAGQDKKEHLGSLASRMSTLCESLKQSKKRRAKEKAKEAATDCGEGVDSEGPDEDAGSDVEGSGEEGNDEAGHNSSDSDEDASYTDQEQQVPIREAEPTLTLHREIYMPVMWHTSLDHLDPDPYRPSEALLVADRNIDDALGVSDDTELVDVLLEEEDLDVADLVAAKEAEAELWAKFGPRENREGAAEEPLPEQRAVEPVEENVTRRRISRKKSGRSRKRIKSNVYVEDSD